MSHQLSQAFGLYQLQELGLFISWLWMHSLGLITYSSIMSGISSMGWWSLLVYLPVLWILALMAGHPKAVYAFCFDMLKGLYAWIFHHYKPNKFYGLGSRLPLLIQLRIKYFSSYRGETRSLTFDLWLIALGLMFLIWVIPFPFGKFILYFILICILAVYCSQVMRYGYMRPSLILSGIIFSHAALYYNLHFGFILQPHQKELWFITVNPTDYVIDFSRIYFAIMLFFSYLGLFKYLSNFIHHWLLPKSFFPDFYERQAGYQAFGLIKVTELTDRELRFWNTQPEYLFDTFLFSIPVFIVGIVIQLPVMLILGLLYPFFCALRLHSLHRKLLNIVQIVPTKKIVNRFVGEWRLDPSIDGENASEKVINQRFDNFLIYVRENLQEDEVKLKELLLCKFPDLQQLKITQFEEDKQEVVAQSDDIAIKQSFPVIKLEDIQAALAEFECSLESIKMIKGRFNTHAISESIHRARNHDGDITQKRRILFQTLES
ncbi:hypothetical protein GCM10010995_08680 [Cysteiniphilum litorale]|uniref:Uncharacterized protein n=1 Tax=Cysteiniphilum litorale TaxID=2056700 RepID=A0A8J2Z3C0_9GAMM|nr:hypothetical protein [Cysteiniphilum sp. SYW-8]GGF93744.1 hypothetical protein GCM10010995_08680 [Cysteiniphilum litorale]